MENLLFSFLFFEDRKKVRFEPLMNMSVNVACNCKGMVLFDVVGLILVFSVFFNYPIDFESRIKMCFLTSKQ